MVRAHTRGRASHRMHNGIENPRDLLVLVDEKESIGDVTVAQVDDAETHPPASRPSPPHRSTVPTVVSVTTCVRACVRACVCAFVVRARIIQTHTNESVVVRHGYAMPKQLIKRRGGRRAGRDDHPQAQCCDINHRITRAVPTPFVFVARAPFVDRRLQNWAMCCGRRVRNALRCGLGVSCLPHVNVRTFACLRKSRNRCRRPTRTMAAQARWPGDLLV